MKQSFKTLDDEMYKNPVYQKAIYDAVQLKKYIHMNRQCLLNEELYDLADFFYGMHELMIDITDCD